MAARIHGMLGTPASPSTTSMVTLYTVPTGRKATLTLSLCNTTSSARAISVGLHTGASIPTANLIQSGTSVPANSVLERSGITMGAGQSLSILLPTWTGVEIMACQCWGVEEDA